MTIEIIQLTQEYITETFSVYPLWVLTTLIFILGACIGSYLNVVIYRSPLKAQLAEQNYIYETYGFKADDLHFIDTPRSHCPSCQSKIPAWLNIPILSWFLLKGKSHCCKSKISKTYPVVEAFVATALAAIFSLYGTFDLGFLLLCLSVCTGFAILAIDFKHKVIFDTHALLYVLSTVSYLSIRFNSTAFIFNALTLVIGVYLVVKVYQKIRNTLFKSDLKMMGDGDWSLWFVLFCVLTCISSESEPIRNLTALAVILIACMVLRL